MEDSGVLWLEKEPTVDEVFADFANFNMDDYDEVVFCGFGEPTERIDVLLEVAAYVKKNYNKPCYVTIKKNVSIVKSCWF